MARKIIQITDLNDTIVALCNDGSVWILAIEFDESVSERKKWKRLCEIPQGKNP
jgi:hypothetical protein